MSQEIMKTSFNYNYIAFCNAFYTKLSVFYSYGEKKDFAVYCLALKSSHFNVKDCNKFNLALFTRFILIHLFIFLFIYIQCVRFKCYFFITVAIVLIDTNARTSNGDN